MQTLVYIIGGYCLIKAVLNEAAIISAICDAARGDTIDWGKIINLGGTTAIMFLAAVEAFNQ